MIHGLGRLVEFDERSRQYPARFELDPSLPLESKTWRRPGALDQGQTPECVGFSLYGALQSQPLTSLYSLEQRTEWSPLAIYRHAQKRDQWPGEDYEGTSVLGGARALRKHGIISEFQWCFGLSDVLNTLSQTGPVVIGITWLNSMFDQPNTGPGYTPDPMLVDWASGQAGGHAIELHGIDVEEGLVIGTNSWGLYWGDEGRFYLRWEDLEDLLNADGEALTLI